MDFSRLLDLAARLDAPAVVAKGISFAADLMTAAADAPHILTAADRAELDMIHGRAIAAADELDSKLAGAIAQG